MGLIAVIAVIALLCTSLFGVKALLVFSSRNGLFGWLEKATDSSYTVGGQPLRPLTTNGRFPKVDQQIKAVCVFFLLYCEDWTVPETCLAGFSFVGAWGASWALIMLDSLRVYSRRRLLSWSVHMGGVRSRRMGGTTDSLAPGSRFPASSSSTIHMRSVRHCTWRTGSH